MTVIPIMQRRHGWEFAHTVDQAGVHILSARSIGGDAEALKKLWAEHRVPDDADATTMPSGVIYRVWKGQ